MVSGVVSTADLLLVVSDRIARAFNRSGINQAVAGWMESLCRNIQIMVDFLNILGPAISLLCINDLSVILLFMLLIPLYALTVMRHLFCGNN